jgi:DHA2 family multidrug resistance protein
VHGFEAVQYAPALIWIAIPQLIIAIIAALLLIYGLDSRLLMAAGFACMAAAALLNGSYTSAWSAENYYRSELLMGVGQSFAFIGLVSTIVLQAIFTGGLTKPQDALTFSAFFHIIRLLGGQIGVAFLTHYIAVREQLHSNLLGLHVQGGTWLDDAAIHQTAAGLFGKSSGLPAATGRAVGILAGRVRLQAYTLTFIDGFHLIAWACVLTLLLIALLKKSPLHYGELGFPADDPAVTQRTAL